MRPSGVYIYPPPPAPPPSLDTTKKINRTQQNIQKRGRKQDKEKDVSPPTAYKLKRTKRPKSKLRRRTRCISNKVSEVE